MNSSVNKIFFFFCISFIVLSGCKQRALRLHKNNKVVQHYKEYTMKVHGVECVFCAHDVVEKLKTIPGVCDAHYQKLNGSYVDGYLVMKWDKEKQNPDLSLLQKVLSKDEFVFSSITGEYAGDIKNKDNKKLFVFSDSQKSYDVQENLGDASDMIQAYEQFKLKKQNKTLGKISYDENAKKFNFYLI